MKFLTNRKFTSDRSLVYCWLKCYTHSNLKHFQPINSVESVRIWSYSGPHFPTFGLNIERYSVSLRIQSECGKMRNRIPPNTATLYAVIVEWKFINSSPKLDSQPYVRSIYALCLQGGFLEIVCARAINGSFSILSENNRRDDFWCLQML